VGTPQNADFCVLRRALAFILEFRFVFWLSNEEIY
jgi:hypothetical protein